MLRLIVGAVLLLQSIARIQRYAHDGPVARRYKPDVLAPLMAGVRAGEGPPAEPPALAGPALGTPAPPGE